MVAEWISCMDKRPVDRTETDLEIIQDRLRHIRAFERLHPSLLQQICYYGYYEDLDRGVTLFRQGDQGANWYAVLAGSLDVQVTPQNVANTQDAVTLCTLGIGTAFGESVLENQPHQATVVTNEHCELLRIEQRDFQTLWERNRHLMEDIVSPLSAVRNEVQNVSANNPATNNQTDNNSTGVNVPLAKNVVHPVITGNNRLDDPKGQRQPTNPKSHTVSVEPPEHASRAGWVLYTLLLSNESHLIRDRKFHVKMFRRCMVGSEMVDWLVQLGAGGRIRVHSRAQAIGMWQTLLEEGVISHVSGESQFKDKYLFYRFRWDNESGPPTPAPTQEERLKADADLQETLALLVQMAPDALFRMILRKAPPDRTVEDLEIIYEELLHIKALSHLSNSVKRELAGVLVFESHPKSGTVLFNQGDEGKSWYIILRGSVDVVIYGKGVVCSLHDGDDFGKLALVNDAPRAATIVTREDSCHFLRVDKDDFNRILRDVEANTVRLKEHGQDVLLLQKIPTDGRTTNLDSSTGPHSHYKYMVMAGTPQKMLEHLLETRIDSRSDDASDAFLEDFLFTHVIFMPSHQLCPELMKHYRIDASNCRQEVEFVVASKRRIIHFVRVWAILIRDGFFEDPVVIDFVEELLVTTKEDSLRYSGHLGEEVKIINRISEAAKRFALEQETNGPQKWKVSPFGHILRLNCAGSQDEDGRVEFIRPIKPTDEIVFRVYCADHTYTTLKALIGATVEAVKHSAAEKLGLKDDLVLAEVKSTGERFPFKDSDVSAATGLTLNGRLFIVPSDHLDALTPLPEQEGPGEGSGALETFGSYDIAYHMTKYEWDLFSCVHEYELIYQAFGRHQFRKIMANLDVFLRRFNEVQFWVVSEMCLAPTLNRRVTVLRKFIKIAALCREYQNMNSFFGIVMGLSNVAVSRLSQTWERLPGKLRRAFAEFETLIDPSRNHRRYRLAVSKMLPPVIPFMPLLLKDMTFSHEGNKTYLEGLVNFEKMHMIAQTLRTLRHCRSQALVLDPPATSKSYQVRDYIRNFRVIDNQRRLTQLSHAIEPRRT